MSGPWISALLVAEQSVQLSIKLVVETGTRRSVLLDWCGLRSCNRCGLFLVVALSLNWSLSWLGCRDCFLLNWRLLEQALNLWRFGSRNLRVLATFGQDTSN